MALLHITDGMHCHDESFKAAFDQIVATADIENMPNEVAEKAAAPKKARSSKKKKKEAKPEDAPDVAEAVGHKIYVKPIPSDMDDEAFEKAFAGYGEVVESYVVRKSRSDKLFGFVVYKEEKDANAAISGHNGKTLPGDDATIEVSISKPQKPRRAPKAAPASSKKADGKPKADPCRLYVGNLSASTTDEGLLGAFGPHGETTECYVVKSSASRCFGFVTYKEARARARTHTHTHTHK